MADQPLLIVLLVVQFAVQALGWAMAANLTGRWNSPEGHFAACWLLLALGLMLYVPAWPSGSAPRNVGGVLVVAAMIFQHRGMTLFWGHKPNDRAYAVWLLLTVVGLSVSFLLQNGHGLRVATVYIGIGALVLVIVRQIWRNGRAAMLWFSALMAGGYGLFGLALFARAVQALSIGAETKISFDAPGHLNVPLAIAVTFVGGMMNLAQIRLVLGRVLQRLTSHAATDPLTGAVNRRGFLPQIEALHARAAHGSHNYAVLMLDVDHFKAVNDLHGHTEGDAVLKRIAQNLYEGLRVGDVVARWGGEEFCVLLPRTNLAEAQALAERLTSRVAATGTPRVTVSIGVVEAHSQQESAEQVIRRADKALYRAKEAGRNRVVAEAGDRPPDLHPID